MNYFLSFEHDSAEARRTAFPTKQREHPTPQVGWHPDLKIKEADGIVDAMCLEDSLQVKQGYYKLKSENVKIFYRSYRPSNIRDVSHGIVLCHGYTDHLDYTIRQVALTMATLNSAHVFTFDIPGHGRSDGLWCLINDWNHMVKQIAEMVETIFCKEMRDNGKPVFCWGYSQGGALAIHLCMSHQYLFKGAILLSPMCEVAAKPGPWLEGLLNAISYIAGSFPLVPTSDNSINVWKDPKIHHSFKLGPHKNLLAYPGNPRFATARELLLACNEIGRRAKNEMKTPFLILHGTDDKVCPQKASKQFHKTAPVKDKTFISLPGVWHGLLTENIVQHYKYQFDWINRRTVMTEP